MGEGTVPVERLDDESKGKTGDVKDLDHDMSHSPKGSEDEKQYPQKVE